jgi:hypothetical protein
MQRLVWALFLGGLGAACMGPAPVTETSATALAGDPETAFVTHPADTPPGRIGKDNCTFAVNPRCTTTREDYACWQHAVGHGGWFRQEVKNLYCPNGVPNTPCANSPASRPFIVSVVRLCRPGGANQVAPCGGKLTGALGCAVCETTDLQCL